MSLYRVDPPSSVIRAEAAAWVAQIESGKLTRADLEALQEWMRRSPRHTRELHRMTRLSGDLNVLTEFAVSLRDATRRRAENIREPRRRSVVWRVAMSCAVAVLAALVVSDAAAPRANWNALLSTAIGEHREEHLPDGSTIALNTDSHVDVAYSAGQRRVRLVRGEAMFNVAHDKSRPFVVDVGRRRVEAIGTAFVVRMNAEAVEVAVAEGRVRVTSNQGAGRAGGDAARWNASRSKLGPAADQPPIIVERGERIELASLMPSDGPVAEAISEADLQRKLAWREGLLDFSDTPLDEVISEVGRHTTLKILFTDPGLRHLRFSGMFRTGQTEPLFEALRLGYRIDARFVDDRTVELSHLHREAEPLRGPEKSEQSEVRDE